MEYFSRKMHEENYNAGMHRFEIENQAIIEI